MYTSYTPYIRKSLGMTFSGYLLLGLVCVSMSAMMA
jgi:hypothetical protein